jgi:hypothetical protein
MSAVPIRVSHILVVKAGQYVLVVDLYTLHAMLMLILSNLFEVFRGALVRLQGDLREDDVVERSIILL